MNNNYSEIAKAMHLTDKQVNNIFDFLYSELKDAPYFVVYNTITTKANWTTQEKQLAFFIWGINVGVHISQGGN